MIAQTSKIIEDIDKLITSIRPNATKQYKYDIQEYFKRLSTTNYKPSQQTATQTKQKIMKKVGQKSDQKTLTQCQQTLNSILGSNQINKKGQLLRMLLKISQFNSRSNNSQIFSANQKISQLNQTKQSFAATNTIVNQSTYTSFSKTRKSVNLQQLNQLRSKGSLEQGICQIDIIKQITYVMQNINANLIKHTESDKFQLQSNINVSQTVRNIVSQLCELGWMYQKIINLLKNKGSIEKALTLGIQQYLNDYYRFLAVIENNIQQKSINLRIFVSWIYQPLDRLKWIKIILQSIQPYSGCTIISTINSFRPHGQKAINQLLNNLLQHMMKPLLLFIHNWVYKGQLIDDNKEFFVEQKQKVNEVTEWFQKYRLVQNNIPNILDKQSAQMIFNAGKTIYFLKNRCRCNYSIPIPCISPQKIFNYNIYDSSTILSLQFKTWLTSVYQNLSAKLINELKHKYHLKYHLESMKHCYLMGKGDFIQHLVDTLKEEMSKPKHQIHEHTLDGYVSDAITKSFHDFRIDGKGSQIEKMQVEGQKNINNRMQEGSEKLIMLKGSTISLKNKKQINFQNSYRSNIIDRLVAKKVQFGQSSWDSFNFQYSFDRIQPLYSIFSPNLVQNYQRIFQFLWKIKRIEHILKEIWSVNQKQYPKTQKNKNFNRFQFILHRCNILRTSMCHFVNTFFGYLMIAIQSAWDKFSLSVQKSQSLDSIIKQHRNLHNELSSIIFSSTNKKNLRDSLMNVFSSIQRFRSLQGKILESYNDFSQKMRTYDNRRKIMARGILNVEDSELQIPYFNDQEVNKRLRQISDIYDKSFNTFYENLKNEGQQTNVLVFRLDFSEFFASKQQFEATK